MWSNLTALTDSIKHQANQLKLDDLQGRLVDVTKGTDLSSIANSVFAFEGAAEAKTGQQNDVDDVPFMGEEGWIPQQAVEQHSSSGQNAVEAEAATDDEVSLLRVQLDTIRQAAAQLSNDLDVSRKQLSEERQNGAAARKEALDVKKQLHKLQTTQVLELQQTIASLQNEVDTLKAGSHAVPAMNGDTNGTATEEEGLEDLKAKLLRSRKQAMYYKKQAAEAAAAQQALAARVEELESQSQQDKADTAASEPTEKLHAAELLQQLQDVTAERDTARETAAELQAAVDKLAAECAAVGKVQEEAVAEVNTLKQALQEGSDKAAASAAAAAADQLSIISAEREAALQQVHQLQSVVDELTNERDALQQHDSSMQGQLTQKVQQAAEAQQAAEQLQRTVAEQAQQLAAAQQTAAQAQQQLHEARAQHDVAVAEVQAEMQSRGATVAAERDLALQQITQLQAEKEQLLQQLQVAAEDASVRARLETELAAVLAQQTALAAKVGDAEELRKSHDAVVQQMAAIQADMQAEVARSRAAVDELKAESSVRDAEHAQALAAAHQQLEEATRHESAVSAALAALEKEKDEVSAVAKAAAAQVASLQQQLKQAQQAAQHQEQSLAGQGVPESAWAAAAASALDVASELIEQQEGNVQLVKALELQEMASALKDAVAALVTSASKAQGAMEEANILRQQVLHSTAAQASLEEQLATVTSNLDALTQDREAVARQRDSLQRLLENSGEQLLALEEQLQAVAAGRDAEQGDAAALTGEIEQLQQQITQLQQDTERAAADGKQLSDQLAAKDAEVAQVLVKLQQASEESSVVAGERLRLEGELQQVRSKADGLVAAADEKVKRLEERLAAVSQESDQHAAELQDVTLRCNDAVAEAQKQQAALAESSLTVASLHAQVESLQQQMADAESALQDARTEAEESKRAATAVHEQHQQLQHDVVVLRQQLSEQGEVDAAVADLKLQLHASQSELAQLQQQLQVQVAEADRRCDAAAAETKRLQKQVTEAEMRCEDAAAESAALQEEVERLDGQLVQLRSEVASKAAVIDKMEEHTFTLSEQLSASTSSAAAAQEQLTRVNVALQGAEQELEALRRKATALEVSEATCKELQAQVQTQAEEVTRVQQQLLEASQVLQETEKERAQLQSRAEELDTKVAQLSQALTAKEEELSAVREGSKVEAALAKASVQDFQQRLLEAEAALQRALHTASSDVASRTELEHAVAVANSKVIDAEAKLQEANLRITELDYKCTELEAEMAAAVTRHELALQSTLDGSRRTLQDEVAKALERGRIQGQEEVQLSTSSGTAELALQLQQQRAVVGVLIAHMGLLARVVAESQSKLEHRLKLMRSTQELEEQYDSTRIRLERLTAELETTVAEVEQLRAESSSRQKKFVAMQTTFRTKENELQVTISNLEARLADVQAQVDGAVSSAKQATEAAAVAVRDEMEARQMLAAAQLSEAVLRQEVEQLQERVSSLTQERGPGAAGAMSGTLTASPVSLQDSMLGQVEDPTQGESGAGAIARLREAEEQLASLRDEVGQLQQRARAAENAKIELSLRLAEMATTKDNVAEFVVNGFHHQPVSQGLIEQLQRRCEEAELAAAVNARRAAAAEAEADQLKSSSIVTLGARRLTSSSSLLPASSLASSNGLPNGSVTAAPASRAATAAANLMEGILGCAINPRGT